MKSAILALFLAGAFAIGTVVASPNTETAKKASADCKCGEKCSSCCGTSCSCK